MKEILKNDDIGSSDDSDRIVDFSNYLENAKASLDDQQAATVRRLQSEPQHDVGSNQYVVRQLEALKKFIGAPDGIKVYLGSARDTTLAEVYGKDSVVHVDMDAEAMKDMQENGYKTVPLSYEAYAAALPDDSAIGMFFSNNSGLVPDSLLDRLSAGGLIIANNWHGSANDMIEKSGFKCIGAVNENSDAFLWGEDACSALGTTEYAVGLGGVTEDNPEVIAAMRENPEENPSWIIVQQENNSDFLWAFRKEGDDNED